MTTSIEEALNLLGAKFCSQCGTELPQPGVQCAACGALPKMTRPELADILREEPGLPARKQAEALRAEAAEHMAQVAAKLREADQILHVDALGRALDYTQGVLEAAIGERKQAGVLLARAEDAEAGAAGPFTAAYANHQAAIAAEEAARRMRRGAEAETEALVRLNAAAEVLKRYQAEAQTAGQAREGAEAAVADADAKVTAAEAARDTAAAAVADPGRARMSSPTMEMLAAPVTVAAMEITPLRFGNPANQFTSKDVLDDDRVAFVVGVFTELGMLTGLLAAESAIGFRKGQEAAEGEKLRQPRRVGDVVITPGAVDVRGGTYAPGVPPEMRPTPGLYRNPGPQR